MQLGKTFRAMAETVRVHRAYRRTCDELWALSDRELRDLGIGRSQIRDIARSGTRMPEG